MRADFRIPKLDVGGSNPLARFWMEVLARFALVQSFSKTNGYMGGFADLDNDGDMDFAIGGKRSGNRLIRVEGARGNWLKVRLVSLQGQAGAFGAKTIVYPAGNTSGRLLGMRESRSNNGYLGRDDPVLQFGRRISKSVDGVVTQYVYDSAQ